MIKLGNRAINRIQLLLEYDIKHLELALENFDDDPIRQAQANSHGLGKYELVPATLMGMEKQLADSKEALRQITDEVDKATFVFGLSKLEDKEEIKGLMA